VADSGDYWRLQGSPYTVHYHKDNEDEHQPVYMIGVERQRNDGWLWGGVYFSNSFGQPSGYLYVGEKVINFSRFDKLFFQWTAASCTATRSPMRTGAVQLQGLLARRHARHRLAIHARILVQAITLGAAGMMFQLAIDLR